jgi:cellulose synthase/poly-beta-1,6-N-acetylglucosamine synthase-like glycosyltransferase
MISTALVVIPARDEEQEIRRCLTAIWAAVHVLALRRPELRVEVVVAADSCRDRTAEISRRMGAHVVEVDAGRVGTARRVGVDAAVALLPVETARPSVWVASTDADTRVPSTWLNHQVELADNGARLVVGRAAPDPRDLSIATLARWRRRHSSTGVGAHIHGANLGFRLDDYFAVGGWPPLAEHEDRELVAKLIEAGIAPVAGRDVVTSGRFEGRAPGGFSGYLRGLDAATTPAAEETRDRSA